MVLLDLDLDKYHLPAEEHERISQEETIHNPFASTTSIKNLNTETQKTLEETDKGIRLIECKDVDGLFKKVGI
jgi:hypothetical protein